MPPKDHHPDAAERRLRIRREAEARVETAGPGSESVDPDDAARLIHELRVHQIELEMQNEELHRVQADLEASQARYFDLYDLAPVGYITLDENGTIQEANLTATSLLGVERRTLVRQPLTRHILPEDRDVLYHLRRVLTETGRPQSCELRMLRTNAAPFWARLEAISALDTGGHPICRVVLADITAHKQIEEVQVFLAQLGGATTGLGFFEALARYLGETLAMNFVCIDRLEGDGLNARTVAVWCDGRFEDNVTYALKDTPCGDVVGKAVCCFPASVCQYFPRDTVLKDLKAESYIGVTLWSHTGQPIGLIAVIGRTPLADRPLAESILKTVAVRAGAEMERTTVESALRESEARYRTMMEQAADAVLMHDATGRIMDANRKACAWLGYTREELLDMSIGDIDPEALTIHMHGVWGRVFAGEQASFESRILRKDGSAFPVEVTLGSVSLPHGPAVLGILRDITERKQTEAVRNRLATAVEHAAETIVITDANGVILYANPAFEKITGYTRAEALGQNPRILKSGRHDPGFYRQMWATLTRGEVWRGHLVNKRKDGTFYEEDASISPVRDAAGGIVNFVAVRRDVTREAALEEQYRQAVKLEAVGRLAGGVAHDFNNKLQIILGCAEAILEELKPDHPSRGDLREIQTAGRRASELARQLLAFSRKQAILPVVLDMGEAIAGSLKMLGRLIGENIRLNFTVPRELWRVYMDPGQLDQILANLAVNARDAISGTGHVFIEAANCTLSEADCRRRPDALPPGDYVALTFRDDGSGIAPEALAHIFEPFFTTKEVGKGTGLGLATVYGIVMQNQGAISVDSAPGQGATFTIHLPRTNRELAHATKEAEQLPRGVETLLLVEDEESALHLIERTLARLGYQVLSAARPARALDWCERHERPIHLLLTDVIMPEMSGKVLADRVRKLRPGIRVLFMSGYTAEIMKQQGHLPDGLDVLQKPFTAAELGRRVRLALDAPAVAPTPPV